ncbi:MAG: hypothetical protein IJA33_03425 [Oscillospiraceae bacterium]|nr:hypothetical protein [Oscillospiraceae bacterium]
MAVVKGVSRRVIVVESPDPNLFEQAIFILRSDGGVTQQQLVDQAEAVAKRYARTHGLRTVRRFQMTPPLWVALGSAVVGAIWAVASFL